MYLLYYHDTHMYLFFLLIFAKLDLKTGSCCQNSRNSTGFWLVKPLYASHWCYWSLSVQRNPWKNRVLALCSLLVRETLAINHMLRWGSSYKTRFYSVRSLSAKQSFWRKVKNSSLHCGLAWLLATKWLTDKSLSNNPPHTQNRIFHPQKTFSSF